MKQILIASAALLAAAGCKKREADAEATPAPPVTAPAAAKAGCAPLRVAIDGQEITNLRGLAVTLKNGEYETEQVELYDSAAITCAEVLAPNMTLPAGTVALRAYYHPEAQGLGTEAYTELGVRGITLVGKGPLDHPLRAAWNHVLTQQRCPGRQDGGGLGLTDRSPLRGQGHECPLVTGHLPKVPALT